MQIGIGLPNPVLEVPGHLPVAWARRAEERGFSSLATIDRIAYPSYDSLTTLAAAAAVTDRIGLVTNVLLGPAYNPVLLAKVTRQHRPALGRPPHPRPRGGWPARRLPGGRPVLRRPRPALRRRPGAAAPGLGGPAGGRQPAPGGPADHPGPHPAAGRRAAAAGGAAGGPLGRRLHHRGRPAGDGQRRHPGVQEGVRSRPAGPGSRGWSSCRTSPSARSTPPSRSTTCAATTASWATGRRGSRVARPAPPRRSSETAAAFEAAGVDELIFDPTVADLDQVDRLADAVEEGR